MHSAYHSFKMPCIERERARERGETSSTSEDHKQYCFCRIYTSLSFPFTVLFSPSQHLANKMFTLAGLSLRTDLIAEVPAHKAFCWQSPTATENMPFYSSPCLSQQFTGCVCVCLCMCVCVYALFLEIRPHCSNHCTPNLALLQSLCSSGLTVSLRQA